MSVFRLKLLSSGGGTAAMTDVEEVGHVGCRFLFRTMRRAFAGAPSAKTLEKGRLLPPPNSRLVGNRD